MNNTTEDYIVQFARDTAPDNWLTVADAGPFDAAIDAQEWIDDSIITYPMRVARRAITVTVVDDEN